MKIAGGLRNRIALIALVAVVVAGPAAAVDGPALAAAGSVAAAAVRTVEGHLPDGSAYLIEVPARWNGTLLLYAHGYNVGPENPAVDVSDPDGRLKPDLLQRGYALAGQSYPGLGWQTPVAVQGQLALLRTFTQQVADPRRVIAWGHSMGGEITVLLAEQHPGRIDAAVPMCPQVAGEVPWFNAYLDAAYTMKTLLDPTGPAQLVGITDPAAAAAYWTGLATTAQQTPAGQARLALAAAFATLPPWSDPASAEPAPTDYLAQQQQQFRTLSTNFAFFQAHVRQDMENRVGGPFSWNSGVDYDQLYRRLDRRYHAEVRALYERASLDLDADLRALQAGPRVAPTDPTAIAQMNTFAQRGRLRIPLLTMHTIGDDIVFPSLETVYERRVERRGAGALLRQTYVRAAGHCNFTSSETLAALLTVDRRLRTGTWPRTTPGAMNARAARTGLGEAHFTTYQPPALPRPGLVPAEQLRDAA
jgi:pimeloyl-ACP methyl ester carboxylesterase